jgi:hypothetical protein
MATFANRVVDKLTFYQWINIEYGIVKREYKEQSEYTKSIMKQKYEEYLKETTW